jgi:hypothetical protein
MRRAAFAAADGIIVNAEDSADIGGYALRFAVGGQRIPVQLCQ